jgi:hypothetical protein
MTDTEKLAKVLKELKMIKREIPRTMGNFNVDLLYDDICNIIKIAEA